MFNRYNFQYNIAIASQKKTENNIIKQAVITNLEMTFVTPDAAQMFGGS